MAAVNDAPQIDVDGLAPEVQSHLADHHPAGADARVIDHQIGRPGEPPLGGIGQPDDGLCVGNVADVRHRPIADLLRGLFGGDVVDVRADHPAAATGDLERESPADTAARAGDHRVGASASAPSGPGDRQPHAGCA